MSSDPEPAKPNTLHSIIAVAIIVIATVAALWPVVKCDFVSWDDPETVSQNPLLKPPGPGGVIRYWKRPAMGLYIPVTYTVWAAIAFVHPEPALFGSPFVLNPSYFHFVNLLIHVCNAILAWVILRRLTGHIWAACAGALLFALHPVQVESVAWVSGLKDVLCGFFSLIVIWQYIVFVQSPPASGERKIRYAVVIAMTFAALLSKPSAVTLPIILAAIDWLLLGRSWRQIAWSVGPILLCCIPPMAAAAISQHPPTNVVFWKRPAVVLDAISFYAIKLVWPTNLAPDYARKPATIFQSSLVWFCWVIPLILATITFVARRRIPAILAGAIIFIAGILPVLGFLSFLFQYKSNVADHYLYASLFGVALALAFALSRAASKLPLAICGAILVALGIQSHRQTAHWQNSETLFAHNLEVAPSWSAHLVIGAIRFDQKRFDDAESHFRKMVQIFPASGNHATLGWFLLHTNRPAESIEPLSMALEMEPGLSTARMDLADAYLKLGRNADAVKELERVVHDQPANELAVRKLDDAKRRF